MTEPSPLPIECLQLIITNLAIERELKTLASLLRVSKQVCLATLPILYRDPFIWFSDPGQPHCYSIRPYGSVIPVIQLLLASVPKNAYSGLVKAMYGISDATELSGSHESIDDSFSLPSTSQHWSIDYLSYVRHFITQDQNGRSVLTDLLALEKLEPRLKSYVEAHRLAETYAALALKTEVGWHTGDTEDPLTIDYLKLNIHREANWALCSPILEQLQSFVIPLSDIDRYLDSIARLSSLSVVTFKLDDYADVDEHVSDEKEIEKLHGLKEKRRRDLESAVKFVQMHTTMFRTLLQVLCPEDHSSCRFTAQSCPEEYLDRMLECLPSLIDPKELVTENWKQFVSKAEQTNVEFVEKIDVWDEEAVQYYQQFKPKPFLHRCSSLQEYNMISLGPDSFKWATQKKNVHDHEQGQGTKPTTGLPPLEVVSIRAISGQFGSELEDIGLSFGATIKSFTIQGHQTQAQTAPPIQSLVIGRGWKMPFLSQLELSFPIERLVLDPDLLRHCPSLQMLTLADHLQVYDLDEIESSRPAHLPELTTLVLSGSGALSFHPDTLHSTKELKVLSLGSISNLNRVVLPSFQDVDQDDHYQHGTAVEASTADLPIHRPKWTWDWRLHNLRALELTFEFAFHFQFKMLRGTPNLHELCLSLYSTGHEVERVLTEADFNVDPLDPEQEERDSGSEQLSKEPASETSLHNQSLETLCRIHSYLKVVHQREWNVLHDQPTEPLQQQQHAQPEPPVPVWEEEQLRRIRENIMDIQSGQRTRELYDRVTSIEDAAYVENTAKELARGPIQMIEELVKTYHLQLHLDAILADCRKFEARKWQEEEDLKRFRVEHPEHLVVPSVRRLVLLGRWIMSQEVLELLLCRVFRNVRELDQCMNEGYSRDDFVRVTQSMPWLSEVRCHDPFDPSSLSDAYKLQAPEYQTFSPFQNDAASRVSYWFVDGKRYVRRHHSPL